METSPPIVPTQPEPPKLPPMSLAGRLANMLVTPGEVFDNVKASPAVMANWLVPAVILIVVSWLCAVLMFSQETIQQQIRDVTAQAVEKKIEKMHLSADQAEQTRQMADKFAGIGQKVSAVAGPVVVSFASPFFWGLILWLVGNKAFKGTFSYMKAVETVGLTNVVLILEAIIKTLLIIGLTNLFASPSLALLVIKEFNPQNGVHMLLATANVMTFWVLTLRAIGLARLSGASLFKSGAWVFGIWAAYSAVMIGFSVAAQKLAGG